MEGLELVARNRQRQPALLCLIGEPLRHQKPQLRERERKIEQILWMAHAWMLASVPDERRRPAGRGRLHG